MWAILLVLIISLVSTQDNVFLPFWIHFVGDEECEVPS